MRVIWFVFIALVAFAGCNTTVEPDDTGTGVTGNNGGTTGKITYQAEVKPILTAKCVSCHGPNGDLSTYTSAKANINDVIDRIQRSAGTPGAMPQGGPKLSSTDINTFIQWKADGLLEK